MKETWKQVWYRGRFRPYEVSDTGRVRRIAGPCAAGRWRPATEIKQFVVPSGYLQVSLSHQTEKLWPMVHALVALVFLPRHRTLRYGRGKLGVNHKDGNKRNNRASNLEWSTYLQNKAHAVQNGLVANGSRCKFTKLDEQKVREIRRRRKDGESTYALGAAYGVSATAIGNLLRRKTWRHVK